MKPHPIDCLSDSNHEVVSQHSKSLIEQRNREVLEQQLLDKQLEFTPRPYEAHIQFSNFCNMSCIMCWNGNNPKTERLTDDLQRKIREQLGPELSVLEPFSGSEPLVLTWEETRDLARQYGVMLCLTTNAQYLDEEKFHELKDITETLYLSVDCHIPEVLEKIRQRANTDKVLANIRNTARLTREHGVECVINIVLLTYNAPFLADTVQAFGEMGFESVNVIQMVDINHESGFFDPLTHYSFEFLDWIKQATIEVARKQRMRLMWNIGQPEVFDDRETPTPPTPRKMKNDHWDWRMRYLLPGFCRNAYNRIRIDVDGSVAPCCYATEGQLVIGNLKEMDFEDIWNGKPAQDLRRGMYTGDVPAICKNCMVRVPPQPENHRPFIDQVLTEGKREFFKRGETGQPLLQVESPTHLQRLDRAPTIEFQTPFSGRQCLLAMSLGGETSQIMAATVEAEIDKLGRGRFSFPDEMWQAMKSNLGYWWTIWQTTGKRKPVCRATHVYCMIRHESLPRMAGSTLTYPDQENRLPIVDIGANKSFGFQRHNDNHEARPDDSDVKVEPEESTESKATIDEGPSTQDCTTEVSGDIEQTGMLMNRARQLLAYGGLDGVMNRPLLHESGTYPQFARKASGCRLTDSTGQEYIDWVNGWGCVFLGHAHPVVNQAVSDQLGKGSSYGLMHPIEVEVAQQLTDMIPCAEKVAFGKNGSDTLNAAIRIARAATGKDLVLQCGFHGFHEWYTCLHKDAQGILPVLRDYVLPFEYNDLTGIQEILERNRGNVAAIVMEPVNMFMPNEGYLEAVASLTREHEALLIFDEVVTAFRLSNGGAQQYFNVIPDLACLGKAMGNGLPLSAVVGKSEFMNHLPSTAFGMTFRGEALSLAGARAVLDFVKEHDVSGHLRKVGDQIRKPFERLAASHGVQCQLSGPSARMTFVFHDQGSMTWQQQRSMFVLECLKRGVLTNGNLLASFAHDENAVQTTLAAFDESLGVVSEAIHSGRSSGSGTQESHYDASALDVQGFIDHLELSGNSICLRGWLLLDGAIADRIEIVDEQHNVLNSRSLSRPDIADAYPDVVNGDQSGFEFRIRRFGNDEESKIKFRLIASQGDSERFHLRISIDRQHRMLVEPKCISDGIVFVP